MYALSSKHVHFNRGIATGYTSNHAVAHAEADAFFRQRMQAMCITDDENFLSTLRPLITAALDQISHANILVDITSLNRLRIAAVVNLLRELVERGSTLSVTFVYAPAAYVPPLPRPVGNHDLGPVLEPFAGWNVHPDQPPSLIVGLGYESELALGVVEHLQTTDVIAFFPHSNVSEYAYEVARANELLIDGLSKSSVVPYLLEDSTSLLRDLLQSASLKMERRAVVFLPFGPKLFSLCACLTAIVYPEVAVWRLRPRVQEPARDRPARGDVISLRVAIEQGATADK